MNLEIACQKAKDKKYAEIADVICNGVQNFETYQMLIGKLKGMDELMDILKPYLRDPDEIFDDGR